MKVSKYRKKHLWRKNRIHGIFEDILQKKEIYHLQLKMADGLMKQIHSKCNENTNKDIARILSITAVNDYSTYSRRVPPKELQKCS